jgi:site-specific recombinase XerD
MNIADAVDSFHQYVLVEKGLSPQTWVSYLEDLEAFFQYFKNKSSTEDLSRQHSRN